MSSSLLQKQNAIVNIEIEQTIEQTLIKFIRNNNEIEIVTIDNLKGADGSIGVDGTEGSIGPDGLPGPRGPRGNTGNGGLRGPTNSGPAGPRGFCFD